MARTLQLSLPAPRTWGGRRAGAGRKLTPGCRPSVPHRPRPTHTAAHPVHVTLRSGPAVRCLRSNRAFPAVRRALYVASRENFRIIHFTVQDDHLHLILFRGWREPVATLLGPPPVVGARTWRARRRVAQTWPPRARRAAAFR